MQVETGKGLQPRGSAVASSHGTKIVHAGGRMDLHVRRVVVADNVAGGRIPVTGEDCLGTLTLQVRRELA